MSIRIEAFNHILWNFNLESFDNVEQFYDELITYNLDFLVDDYEKIEELAKWNPLRNVIDYKKVKIAIEDEGNDDWIYFEADNSKFFTAIELLFKINKLYVEEFQETHYVFLEGVTIIEEADIPEIDIRCGS